MRMQNLIGAIALLTLVPAALRAQDAPMPGPTIVIVPEGADKAAAGAGVVNINQASADELMRLPGIGPSKAQAIVTYRSKSKFVRKEQLLSVRGIGPKLLQQLRPYIAVDGATTLRSKVKLKR